MEIPILTLNRENKETVLRYHPQKQMGGIMIILELWFLLVLGFHVALSIVIAQVLVYFHLILKMELLILIFLLVLHLQMNKINVAINLVTFFIILILFNIFNIS